MNLPIYLVINYSLPLVKNYRPLLFGLAQTFENREKERRKKRGTLRRREGSKENNQSDPT